VHWTQPHRQILKHESNNLTRFTKINWQSRIQAALGLAIDDDSFVCFDLHVGALASGGRRIPRP
jgi:hypothetical protein